MQQRTDYFFMMKALYKLIMGKKTTKKNNTLETSIHRNANSYSISSVEKKQRVIDKMLHVVIPKTYRHGNLTIRALC